MRCGNRGSDHIVLCCRLRGNKGKSSSCTARLLAPVCRGLCIGGFILFSRRQLVCCFGRAVSKGSCEDRGRLYRRAIRGNRPNECKELGSVVLRRSPRRQRGGVGRCTLRSTITSRVFVRCWKKGLFVKRKDVVKCRVGRGAYRVDFCGSGRVRPRALRISTSGFRVPLVVKGLESA